MAGPHLEDEESGGGVGTQHGERHAEFVVQRADCGGRRSRARQHRRQQILGTGLPLGTGYPDDGQPVAQPADDVNGECLQCRLGVIDDDGGQRCGPRAQHGDRACLAGLAGVIVAVDVFAYEGGEETAGLGLATVKRSWRRHHHIGIALDRPVDDRGDVADAEGDHGRVARRPTMRSDMLSEGTGGHISSAYRKTHTW